MADSISEHQRSKLLELYNWYDLDHSGLIDSAEELKQLACNTMCKMSPESVADPDLVIRFVDKYREEAEAHGGIDFERFVSIVVPALHIPARTPEELDLDQANHEIMALCNSKSDVVVVEHANPELEDKVFKYMVLINIHDLDVRNRHWDEIEPEIDRLARGQRPLTLLFSDPDGQNVTSHTFVGDGPLRLRWADRLKLINDEIHSLNTKLIAATKGSPLKSRIRADLKVLEDAVQYANNRAREQRSPRHPRQ